MGRCVTAFNGRNLPHKQVGFSLETIPLGRTAKFKESRRELVIKRLKSKISYYSYKQKITRVCLYKHTVFGRYLGLINHVIQLILTMKTECVKITIMKDKNYKPTYCPFILLLADVFIIQYQVLYLCLHFFYSV